MSTGLIKFVANSIAALGVGAVIDGIIKNNVIPKSTTHKVLINVGTFVLGTLVVDKARTHFNTGFDNFVNLWKKAKEEVEEETEPVKK
jgi:hypothetical protein